MFRSYVNTYWMTGQMQAREGRQKTGKKEALWLGRRARPHHTFQSLKGDTEQGGSPLPLPNPSVTCLSVVWALHLGVSVLRILTSTESFPYITNPGNSYGFNLKQINPCLDAISSPTFCKQYTNGIMGLQIGWGPWATIFLKEQGWKIFTFRILS